jgi:hypothetical protein
VIWEVFWLGLAVLTPVNFAYCAIRAGLDFKQGRTVLGWFGVISALGTASLVIAAVYGIFFSVS